MKKLYVYLTIFLFALAFIPWSLSAQCFCSDGAQPDSVIQTVALLPTSNFNNNLSFSKFNIPTGTLFCIDFTANISTVANLGIRNLDSAQQTYRFRYTQDIAFSGPGGISDDDFATKNYGPTILDKYNTGIDSANYGPDTTFKNRYFVKTTSNVTPYLGSGNVNINFTNTGSTTLQQGSNNYRSTVRTFAWGEFTLKYFWCPNSLLATSIKNFAAYKNNKNILLKWSTENKTSGTGYEIEYSQDGRTFSGIGEINPKDLVGNTTQHEFQYQPAGTAKSGKLYFRIKQINTRGIATYSSIRTVDMNENSLAGFMIYPNPVARKVSMLFDRSLNGNYVVEVTNLAGQILYNRNIKVTSSNNIQFELANPPPSGMYYLKVTDTKSKIGYTNKLFIQR